MNGIISLEKIENMCAGNFFISLEKIENMCAENVFVSDMEFFPDAVYMENGKLILRYEDETLCEIVEVKHYGATYTCYDEDGGEYELKIYEWFDLLEND